MGDNLTLGGLFREWKSLNLDPFDAAGKRAYLALTTNIRHAPQCLALTVSSLEKIHRLTRSYLARRGESTQNHLMQHGQSYVQGKLCDTYLPAFTYVSHAGVINDSPRCVPQGSSLSTE